MVIADDEKEEVQMHKCSVEHQKETMMWWKSRVQSLPWKGQENTSGVGKGCATRKTAKRNIWKHSSGVYRTEGKCLPDE